MDRPASHVWGRLRRPSGQAVERWEHMKRSGVLNQRGSRLGGILAVVVLILAACGGAEDGGDGESADPAGAESEDAGDEGHYGGDLRMAVSADASSLDPQSGPSGTDHIILYPMYDTLIDFDPETTEPRPGLAQAWEFTDPTTLRLELQPDVQFHDGTDMDAEAVKASLERFQEVGAHLDLAVVESIDVVDELTVELNLAQPDSSIVLVLADRAGMVVSPSAAEEHGDEFETNPVGAGPFQFVEWREGDQISMERFEDYWQEDLPYLDSIRMDVLTDRGAATNAILGGEIHFSDSLDHAQRDQLDAGDLVVQADNSVWVQMMYLNMSHEPLDDVRVRQAINYAINREDVLQAATGGAGEVARSPVPSTHWAYDPATEDAWEHDPDRARELLEEAGVADGFEISGTFMTDATDLRRNEVIQAQLEEVGIQYDLNPMDLTQGVTEFFEEQSFDVAQYAWSGRPDPGQTYFRLFAAESYQNPGDVAIDGMEQAINAAVEVEDIDERAERYADVNELMVESAPWVPLYFQANLTAHVPELRNYEPNLLGKPKVAEVQLAD